MAGSKKRKTTKDDKGFTKNQQITVAVAIIGALGLFFGSTTFNSMWTERAIIEISFGEIEGYPLQELQFDGNDYYIDIGAINRGLSQTNPLVKITAEGATLSFDKQTWLATAQNNVLIRPNEEFKTFRIYVQPDGPNSITISLFQPTISIPHEVYLVNPANLVFQFNDGNYILSKSY